MGVEPVGAAARAVELAATGVDGLFSFENAHDVFVPLVLAAGAAPGVDLMTNVAVAFPRSPVHLAHAAYDLQLLSQGRFRLGLGSQVRAHIERRYGATWSKPAARLREQVLAIKAVFAAWEGTAPLDFHGTFSSHTYMPPVFNPGPNPFGPPPVLVGALGPLMTENAAEVADGLLVMPFNSIRHLTERTRPAIERGLARAGRVEADLEVIGEVIVAMGHTPAEQAAARAGARFLLAFYASTPAYRPVLEVEGWGELQPRLQQLTREGRWGELPAMVDDDMVDRLAVAGSPAECAAQIGERFGGWAQRVCCYFPGYPVTDAAITDLVSALHAVAPSGA
jgi:probable F420-dependent oxidoreductase